MSTTQTSSRRNSVISSCSRTSLEHARSSASGKNSPLPTWTSAWTSLSRREVSEMPLHRSTTAKRYYSTFRMRVHKRGSTCGQAVLAETDQLLLFLRRASLRSSRTGVLRRAQLQTRHPRGGKLWVPRERRRQPDRSGSGQHCRRDGRIVPSAERRLRGTPLPDHSCDHPGTN